MVLIDPGRLIIKFNGYNLAKLFLTCNLLFSQLVSLKRKLNNYNKMCKDGWS